MVALAGIFIAAVNTIANICIAPFVNSMGKQHCIHPYRRATILATVICTFPFVLPYGGCVLLLQKGVEASACGVNIQATDVFFTTFYPWALLVLMLIGCSINHQKNAQ
jgi:Na+/H+ antiporter NhaC